MASMAWITCLCRHGGTQREEVTQEEGNASEERVKKITQCLVQISIKHRNFV